MDLSVLPAPPLPLPPLLPPWTQKPERLVPGVSWGERLVAGLPTTKHLSYVPKASAPQGGGRKFPFTPRAKSKAGVRGKVLGKLGPHLGQGCPPQNLGIVILNPSLTPSSNPSVRPPGCSSKIHLRSSSLHTIAQPGSSHPPLLSCPVQPPWGSLPQACSLSLPVYPTSSAEGSFRNRNPITGPRPETFRNLSPRLG